MSTSRTERLGFYGWFVFGHHRDDDTMVSVMAGPNVDLGFVEYRLADMMIEEHNRVLAALEDALCKLEACGTSETGPEGP